MGSIKYYIFTRFSFFLLIQIIVVSFAAHFYFEKNIQLSIDQSFRLLRSTSKNIEYFYSHQAKEFSRLIESNGFRPYHRETAENILKSYMETRQLVSSIHYYNNKGELEFALKGDKFGDYQPESHYKLHSDPKFIQAFEKVLHDKTSFTSSELHTKSGQIYHVTLIPSFDQNNHLQGILTYSQIPLNEEISENFKGLHLFAENFLALVDENGVLIAASNMQSDSLKAPLAIYIQNRGRTKDNPHQYQYKNLEKLKYQIGNRPYYLLSKKLHGVPLFAVMGVSEAIIDREIKRLISFTITILSISILIGLLAAFVISNKLSEGLKLVLETLKDMRKGAFKRRPDIPLHQDFKKAIDDIHDVAIEVEKGKLMGNFWGQEATRNYEDRSF